jgi:hypothetical protein
MKIIYNFKTFLLAILKQPLKSQACFCLTTAVLFLFCIPGYTQHSMSVAEEMALKNLNSQKANAQKNTPSNTVNRSSAAGIILTNTLALTDPTFNRPAGVSSLSSVGTAVHYKVLPIILTCAEPLVISFNSSDGGSITTNSEGMDPDTYLFLYGSGGFNPASPLSNLLAADDDSGDGALSKISTSSLASGTYTIVVTSFYNTPPFPDDLTWNYNLAVNGNCVLNGSSDGTVNSSTTVCSGTNTTVLTLTGNTGTVVKWQSSLLGTFTDAVDIASTMSSLTITNIAATTSYRAVTTSIVSNSTSATITLGSILNSTASTCFSTIQNAINAASPNDVIQIPAGTYLENIMVNKNLTFQFMADNDVTISNIQVSTGNTLKHNKSFITTTFTNNGTYSSKGFAGKLINTGSVAPK